MKENADTVLSPEEQMQGYTEAVKSGLYAKRTGLFGKYDNCRRYWEDELTRIHLRPWLQKLLEYCHEEVQRLRILDMGCGSADGYELLAGVRDRDPDLCQIEVDILNPASLGLYKGVDLNTDLLEQARQIYGGYPKMCFEQADLTRGIPLSEGEDPFDLYFTSYGTCSHFNDDQEMIDLLADIAARTNRYAIVVCDWIGRYSYEWQRLWTHDHDTLRNMDYVVSYIYEPEEREQRREELQHLNLRLMSREEAENIFAAAEKKSGVTFTSRTFFDRSVFIGRHMDTREYNPHAQPIRQMVNNLHEVNVRTDLNALIIDYAPKQDFEFLNRHYELIQSCWNALVVYVENMLQTYDPETRRFTRDIPGAAPTWPEPLRNVMNRMHNVVEGVGWLKSGLPRENIIEPQLGYALRHIVSSLQEGRGCGHGLIGILEIDKRKQ
jgi:SAM-dependent methyltransferase